MTERKRKPRAGEPAPLDPAPPDTRPTPRAPPDRRRIDPLTPARGVLIATVGGVLLWAVILTITLATIRHCL